MPATFETLAGLERSLAARGHLPLTPWWREQLRRFYAHPTARSLVARVGRGGVKSTSALLFSMNEVLFGDWDVPPGEVHYFAAVSATKDEAAQRLLGIERRLLDLKIPHHRDGDQIRLREMPRGWRVFACQVGAVSGFRCVGYVCDELAKWRSADRFTNPAGEVVASLNGMLVTHAERARRLFVSSPMARTDYHFERCALGDTEDQIVCEAPTWVANPAVSEEQTRKLEPDPRIWRREYAAIPQANASAAFEADTIEAAFEPRPAPERRAERVIVLDPSSGRKDAWTWCIVGWAFRESGESYLEVDIVDGVEGTFFQTASAAGIVDRVAALAESRGIAAVHADQREAFALKSAFEGHGLEYTVHDWTAQSKPLAIEKLRRWFAEGRVALPKHRKLRSELLSFEERVTPAGTFTFGARGSGHDDYVALLITAVMAIGDNPNGSGFSEADRDAMAGFLAEAEAPTRWDEFEGRGF